MFLWPASRPLGFFVARFGDHLHIPEARFANHSDIAVASFGDPLDRSVARFADHSDITVARFADHLDISAARFEDYSDITVARLADHLNITVTCLGDPLDISVARFPDHLDISLACFAEDWDIFEFCDPKLLTFSRFLKFRKFHKNFFELFKNLKLYTDFYNPQFQDIKYKAIATLAFFKVFCEFLSDFFKTGQLSILPVVQLCGFLLIEKNHLYL